MIDVPLIDELREIRRRLADRHANDPVRYAEMLRGCSRDCSTTYITQPLRSDAVDTPPQPISARK